LQRLYEIILGRTLDKRNFRKKILSMNVLEELNEDEVGVARRPARLYRFHKKQYEKLARQGFNFEI
jgi:8-oxo-dGTP diphosphatase